MLTSPDRTYPQLDVTVRRQGTTRTISAAGEIDLASAGRLRAPLLAELRDGAETLVLDLGETSFIDSSGVHLVLEVDARARDLGARLVILPGPPDVQRIFELCGLASVLNIADANGADAVAPWA